MAKKGSGGKKAAGFSARKTARRAMRKVRKHGPLVAALAAGVAGISGIGAAVASRAVRGRVRTAVTSAIGVVRARRAGDEGEGASEPTPEQEGTKGAAQDPKNVEESPIASTRDPRDKKHAPNGIAGGVGPV